MESSDTENLYLMNNEDQENERIQVQDNQPKKTWRQVLNKEFSRLWNNETTAQDLSDDKIRHYRTLISHTLNSFTSLVIPLTITFICTLLIIRNLPFFQDKTYIFAFYTPIEEKEADSFFSRLQGALLNSSLFLLFIIVQTVILVLLYKYECYRVIHGFLNLAILSSLFFLGMIGLTQITVKYNLPLDWFTFIIILLNYSVVGVLAIFTNLSPRIQQIYHVITSAFMSSILIRVFPEWTGWVILLFLVIWDLIAVLAPFGPLKMLVEIATERNEPLFPALVFKTMITPDRVPSPERPIELDEETTRENLIENIQEPQTNDTESEEVEYQGSQLGLGDFVFFSLLIGKAANHDDFNVVFACYIAIMSGFLITFLILICLGRALPALPVSLILGLLVYLSTQNFLAPLFKHATENNYLF